MLRSRFERQLEALHGALTGMGELCREAISAAVAALLSGDREMAAQAVELEREIDRRERDIGSLCMKLLLQQQPVARDLRAISSAMKMISDMERIGDQAADIADIACQMGGAPLPGRLHITEMTQAAMKMVGGSVEAFVKSDLSLAKRVAEYDDVVDGLFLQVKGELMELILADASAAGEALDLLMVAKYLERIGDHAVNVAEWVAYALTGSRRPEGPEESGERT